MDLGDKNYYSRRTLHISSSTSNQNQVSACPADSVPRPTLTRTHRNALLHCRYDEINDERTQKEYHGNQIKQTRLQDTDFVNHKKMKNTVDRNVYNTHANDMKRQHLAESGCTPEVGGCMPINMCNRIFPGIPTQYSYNRFGGTVKEALQLQEDRPRRTWTQNLKSAPVNVERSNYVERTTYSRPISGCYNQEYVFKTLEHKKKLQALVKKMAAARDKEKRKAAWDEYIKQLKLKHETNDALQQPTTSKATPNTLITSDTLEDYYNTKFNSDFSNHCKHLLNDIYSQSNTMEANKISIPLQNKVTNKSHSNKYSNSREKTHFTCIPTQPYIKIPLETNHYPNRTIEHKHVHLPYVNKFNPYIGLPIYSEGRVQNPYLCYPTSSARQSGCNNFGVRRPRSKLYNKQRQFNESRRKRQKCMNELTSSVFHRNCAWDPTSKPSCSNLHKYEMDNIRPESNSSNSRKSSDQDDTDKKKTRVTYKKDAETQKLSTIHIYDSDLEGNINAYKDCFSKHDFKSDHTDHTTLKKIEEKLDVLITQMHLLLNKNCNVVTRNSGGIKQLKTTPSISRTESHYTFRQHFDRKNNDAPNEITFGGILDTKSKSDEVSKICSKLDPKVTSKPSKTTQISKNLEQKLELAVNKVTKSTCLIDQKEEYDLVSKTSSNGQIPGVVVVREQTVHFTSAQVETSGDLLAQKNTNLLADATTSDRFNLHKDPREARHKNPEIIHITDGNICGQTATRGYIIDLKNISGHAAIAGITFDQKSKQVLNEAAPSGCFVPHKSRVVPSTISDIARNEQLCKETDFLNPDMLHSHTFSFNIKRDAEDDRRKCSDNTPPRSNSLGKARNESNLSCTKDDTYGKVITVKSTSTFTGSYVNLTPSKIDEILIEEMDKSDKAKRDIEDILNGDRARPYGVQITFDVPTKECCTEVSHSLSKTKTIEEVSINSMSCFPEQLQTSNRRLTIAVNTDPLSLRSLLTMSTATITRFLSYMIFDYHAFLPRPRLVSNPIVRPHMGIFNCNLCGTCFDRTKQLSDHVRSREQHNSRDCCVCRHLVNTSSDRYRAPFRCRYCGKTFTRAYCCELHEVDCARAQGMQHDVPENLAFLN